MSEQKKLPSELEENIQNLAGDIYLQIEDKITALITSYSENLTVSPELIEQHPRYQQLENEHEQQVKSLDDKKHVYEKEISNLLSKNDQLINQINSQKQELESHAKLNTAKLTDTEQVLKEKLQENSQLAEQVVQLNSALSEHQSGMTKFQQDSEVLSEQHSKLKAEHENLSKTDKAKAATITVQNQQISELQLKHEQVASELELIKAQQEQSQQANNELLSNEQEQTVQLVTQRQQLESEVKQQQDELTKLNEKCAALTDENIAQKTVIAELKTERSTLGYVVEEYKQQLTTEQGQILTLQKEYSEQSEKTAHQVSENKALITELEQQKEAIENLQFSHKKAITDLDNNIALQVSENEDLVKKGEQQKEKYQQDIDNWQSSHQQVVIELENTITDFSENKIALTQKLNALEQEVAQTIASNNDLADQNKKLKYDHQQVVIEFENTITDFSENKIALTQKLNALEQEVAQTIASNNDLADQNKKLKDKQQQEIQKLHANHQQLTTGFEQSIEEKTLALSQFQQQADSQIKDLKEKINQQMLVIAEHNEQIAKGKSAYQTLFDDNENVLKKLDESKQQVCELEQQLQTEKSAIIKNRQMVQESKNKQELEYNKARETIKYLRDENTDLNHKLEQQVNELEDKLTEYRLRFEYAQKQLTKMAK